MAKLGINTGSTPDAGDGDSLLVGAIKINSNFDELYNVLGDGTNVSNTIGYASTSGISTLSQGLSGTPNITVGIVTASFVNVTGSGTSTTQLRVTGVSTLSTTNISGDLTFTGSNDIYLKDNGVANFGNSNDLQIYHNGSFSVIKDDGTGGLVVYSDGVGIGTENITNTLTVAGSGTSTSQLYVTGVSTFVGNVTFKGSVSGNTIITDGSIYSPTGFTTFAINVARGVDFIEQNGLGKVRISGDQGVGNGRIGFYNSSNNLVSTWDTNLSNGSIDIYNYTNSGTQNITISAGSSVVLQHGGTNTKLQTTSSGITVTGTTLTNQLNVGTGGTVITTTATGLVGVGTTNPTSALTVVGSGTSTSQLYVTGVSTFNNFIEANKSITINGSNSEYLGYYLDRPNGGYCSWVYNYTYDTYEIIGFQAPLILNGKNYVRITSDTGVAEETLAQFNYNGSVDLYYNNSKKFETLGTGVTVTGTTFTNQLSVSGVTTCTGSVRVGVDTSAGVILTSPNGTKYQLFVEDDGTLKTVAV